MNDLKVVKDRTTSEYDNTSSFQKLFKSIEQKISSPLKIEKSRFNYPAITANNNNATILVILIIGFTAGPAVSL